MYVSFKNLKKDHLREQVRNVSPEEVWEHKDNIEIIDVRQPDEYHGKDLGHIQGAQLYPLGILPEKISELSKDKTLVFVCRSGNRSGQAVLLAQENQLQECYNLEGGMISWNEKNLNVEISD